jgi:hypothetical protein
MKKKFQNINRVRKIKQVSYNVLYLLVIAQGNFTIKENGLIRVSQTLRKKLRLSGNPKAPN